MCRLFEPRRRSRRVTRLDVATWTFALAIAGAARAQPIWPELGPNDFRVSFQGGTGNVNPQVFHPDVAYDPFHERYLVVWTGDDDVGGLMNGEEEVFGQRLSVQPLLFADGFESGDTSAWS